MKAVCFIGNPQEQGSTALYVETYRVIRDW